MAAAGTLLTADANLTTQGDYRILTFKSSGTFYRGSLMMESSGTAIAVPANNGSTDYHTYRVIGQAITASTDTVLGSTKVNVRTDGVFQMNILSGDTLTVGALCYATSDNEAASTVNTNNPVAGIVVSTDTTAGTCMVKVSLAIPA